VKRKDRRKFTDLKKNTGCVSLSADNSPYVFQRDKINFDLKINELPWTTKQKAVIDIITNKSAKIVFLNGPAGSSKSLLAVYCALKMLASKKVSEIIYIRSIIESASRSLGSLPGESDNKFKPFSIPLIDKLEELTKPAEIKKLLEEERVKPTPVNYLRGTSFNVNFIIADEMQNAVFSELQTIMTRLGQFSKLLICGDPAQSDLPVGKSGFLDIYNAFNNVEAQDRGIYCVEFDESDIMRSEICRYIVTKFTELRKSYVALKEKDCKKSTHNHQNTNSTTPNWCPQRD
jgi:phosphate starvation-inducible PhoH-like protein